MSQALFAVGGVLLVAGVLMWLRGSRFYLQTNATVVAAQCAAGVCDLTLQYSVDGKNTVQCLTSASGTFRRGDALPVHVSGDGLQMTRDSWVFSRAAQLGVIAAAGVGLALAFGSTRAAASSTSGAGKAS